MTRVAIIASAAISALGRGRAASDIGLPGEAARSAIRRDPELAEAGLRKPFAARVGEIDPGPGDRAARLLSMAGRDVAQSLDRALPDWRSRRVAIAVGTSGGGMPSLVEALRLRAKGESVPEELARAAPYFGPLAALDAAVGAPFVRRAQILAACASSTVALGIGCRWLDLDEADVVVAGGYDALCTFIAAGFEVLGATSTSPRPFRTDRDGMALGEGAALFALVRASDTRTEPLGFIRGFSAASDAVHVTAPDREGRGLTRAARAALSEAGLADGVDIVSAHGTATPFNDAAESRAVAAALGEHVSRAVVHPFKAAIGHTLGAAGALELGAALDAMQRGILPASVGSGALEPELSARLLVENLPGTPQSCLKLSAAFGGSNAALVAARSPAHASGRERAAAELRVIGIPVTRFDLDVVSARSRRDRAKLARLDPLSGLAATAVAHVLERCGGVPPGSAIVIGSVAATIELDDAFDRRCRERGAAQAEPRRFPPTSPNLCAGECSIAFGIDGPSLAVGYDHASPLEALAIAQDLIEAGDAPAALVVAADQVGPAVADLWARAGWPVPAEGAVALLLTRAEGAPLDRGRLAEAHARARADKGQLGEATPGWPALLAAVGGIGSAADLSGVP